MTIDQYLQSINKRYRLGNATEHTFRGDLQQLLENIVPSIRATNEPNASLVERQIIFLPEMIFQ